MSSIAVSAKEAKTSPDKLGLAFWMNRVLEECERAAPDLAVDPVHDLRVSLRRCRSMAEGIMAVDPDPGWRAMRKAGKRLFSSLGELRDVQVMQEWVQRLGSPDDSVTADLLLYLREREHQLKEAAILSLGEFDTRQWAHWSKQLPRRAARLKHAGLVFKLMALERWTEARQLHSKALRGGSKLAWHRLRIGLKRFRYVVENFLPHQHAAWKDDLKGLQDLLGEIHDLDVLWATALEQEVFPDLQARSRWHTRILQERSSRIDNYRSKMVGKTSLWGAWRAQLPQAEEIAAASLLRMKLWASFRDPDFQHSSHVARLALQLFDGLTRIGKIAHTPGHDRSLLRFAALGHDVGRLRRRKNHQKISYRLIRQMATPMGWQEEDLKIAAAVARYHRGALPRAGQKAMAQLLPAKRQHARRLAAILRLADAFDAEHDGRIRRVKVSPHQGVIVIAAEGYSQQDRLAESIAAARHLLETVCRCPVIVRQWRKPAPGVERKREARSKAA